MVTLPERNDYFMIILPNIMTEQKWKGIKQSGQLKHLSMKIQEVDSDALVSELHMKAMTLNLRKPLVF